MIARATGTIPQYGSPEWLRLPDGSLEKVASVIRAAENWAIEGDTLTERLRAEVTFEREAYERAEALAAKRAEDAAFVARAADHRARWDASLPGYVTTDAERAEIEADWLEWVGGAE